MRDYANIITAIWRDHAFRALDASAQRTYLMLVTQEDISGAGTLALTVRRWASNAADTTRETVSRDLTVLEAGGFVFADEDTEELLVRTFVRHDKGYNNPKRRPVILAAAGMLRSLKLRRVLWAELDRLGLVDSLPPLPDPSMDSLSGSQADSHTAENRVVVTVGTTDTSTLNPQVPPSAGAAAPRAELVIVPDPGPEPRTVQELVAWWIDQCEQRPDRSTIGQVSKHIKALRDEGFEPVHIRRGLNEWAAKGLHPSTLPSIVTHAANRNAPIRAAPPQPTRTEATFAANQQVAQRLRAIEGSAGS